MSKKAKGMGPVLNFFFLSVKFMKMSGFQNLWLDSRYLRYFNKDTIRNRSLFLGSRPLSLIELPVTSLTTYFFNNGTKN